MVPVPVTVRLVMLFALKPLVPATIRVPVPVAKVRTLVVVSALKAEPAPLKVAVYELRENVPEFKASAVDNDLLDINASAKVTDPLNASIVIDCVNVRPALVIV